MPDVIGIDHIYITVRDLSLAQAFYDRVMPVLGFRAGDFEIDGDRHRHYFNRHFSYVLRPARTADRPHDPYAPGLHHLCFRVESHDDVNTVAVKLHLAGIAMSGPMPYPEYAPDYYALFLTDPDGLRLEVTNYRAERRQRHDHWDEAG